MITMMHSNPAVVCGSRLLIDRKFHLGMKNYVNAIPHEIVSIHPLGRAEAKIMDAIEVPLKDLDYRVITVDTTDSDGMRADRGRMVEQLRSSDLVYGGGMKSEVISTKLRVPQIAVLECDLATQIRISVNEISNPLRIAARAAKTTINYYKSSTHWRESIGIHCNGYPIFDETANINADRILYLDSRMESRMVVDETVVLNRFLTSSQRPLKLLFSGRYEGIKGGLSCVRVALICIGRGMNIEMHCYGQGVQRAEMDALAASAEASGKIVIHDAVTYPELVEIAKGFDLFVCCHIQSDPSCTYLESFGSGLPIVGYSNKMWKRLSAESGAGFCSEIGRPELVADDIEKLVSDKDLRRSMSLRAREFALEHSFEREFKLRTDDINRKIDACKKIPISSQQKLGS